MVLKNNLVYIKKIINVLNRKGSKNEAKF